jgi:hypothetical protein
VPLEGIEERKNGVSDEDTEEIIRRFKGPVPTLKNEYAVRIQQAKIHFSMEMF